jgi:alpha-glucan,water dikinase
MLQVISQMPAQGRVVSVADMAAVQGKRYREPVILLADHMGGMEDIPPGVTGVITRSSTDVLSHIAIRARNQRVLLATCFSDEQWGRLQAYSVSEMWRAEGGAATMLGEEAGRCKPVCAMSTWG